MIIKISKMDKIMERLKLEGKSSFLTDHPDYKNIMEEMDEQLLNVRRDYKIKAYWSEHNTTTILTSN